MPNSEAVRIANVSLPRAWLTLFGVLIIATILVTLLTDHLAREDAVRDFDDQLQKVAAVRGGRMQLAIDAVGDQAIFLSKVPVVRGVAKAASDNGGAADQAALAALQDIYGSYLLSSPNALQASLLGVEGGGRELIRVERKGEQTSIAPFDQLKSARSPECLRNIHTASGRQSYSAQFYMQLAQGRKGPHQQPLLRVCTPVFDRDAKLFGAVELTFDATRLANPLRGQLPVGVTAYFVGTDGKFVVQPEAGDDEGMDLSRSTSWSDGFDAVPGLATADAAVEFWRHKQGDQVRTTQHQVSLDSTHPERHITFMVTGSETVIADRVAATRKIVLLAMLGVAVGACVVFYLFTLGVKRRLQALLEQARLSAIVTSSGDAIISTTVEGRIHSWNSTAAEMFGYRESEVMGLYLADVICDASHAEELAIIDTALTRGELLPNFTSRRRCRDGSLLDVSITVSPIRNPSGQVVGAAQTIRDISEQKQNEAKILDMNANLEQQVAERVAEVVRYSTLQRAILNSAGYAIISTNVDGLIQSFNPAAEAMFGYSADEVIGRLTPGAFHDQEEARERAVEMSAELGVPVSPAFEVFVIKAQMGLPNVAEWTYHRRDGSRFPVLLNVTALRDEAGVITGYLGILMDLTERNRQQREKQRLIEILEMSPDYIGVSGIADSKSYFHNRAARRMLGLPEKGDLTLMQIRAPFTPDSLQYFDEFGRPVLMTDNVWHGELAINGPDGREIPVSAVALLHRDADGNPEMISGILRDTSEQKQRELELAAARRQAEEASLAKSSFLANMSHEIRTPMNAVLGMLQLLRLSQLNARQTDYASKAESSARALLSILNDILDFSKVEAGKLSLDPHPFRIDQLLRDLAVIMSSTLGARSLELLFDVDPALPQWVVGDALRLQQVLINLSSNAIKFTTEGEVVVRVWGSDKIAQGPSITFSVRDTGIGISEEQRRHIFEGFSQAEISTTRRFGGTGLGLAISQRLVSLMGGTLEVVSEPGKGSDFFFTVPLERAHIPAAEVNELAERLRGMKTLIINGNSNARQMLGATATSLGWHTDVAADGAAGLQLLLAADDSGSPYRLVLIDANMHAMDGWETCRRIRRALNVEQQPLLILTVARGDDFEARRAQDDDVSLDGFLVKPVTASMLFDSVASAMALPAGERAPVTALGQLLEGVRILLVEDNPTNQQVAQELLSQQGALVQVANGGTSCLLALNHPDQMFDVVLMDIQMPDMDGYTATREIRERLALVTLPIIAMTANVMAADRQACLDAGMNDHVGKPFDLNELIAVIARHVGRQPVTETAPTTALPEQQQELAWIDPSSALKRFGGARATYGRALNNFMTDADVLSQTLTRCLAENQLEVACTHLHSLKGAAGTIGAYRLAALAAKLEASVRVDALMQSQLDELQTAIVETVAMVRQVRDEMLPQTVAPSAKPLDAGQVLSDLRELSRLLHGANLRAIAVYAPLREPASKLMPEVASILEDALGRLDFVTAGARCDELIEHVRTL